MTWYFDSHIHLSDPFYASEINTILQQMDFLNIKACGVSVNAENSLHTLRLGQRSGNVLPFVGIHPEYACDDLDKMVILIEKNHQSIFGIGEIGLDPTYVSDDIGLKKQIQIFEKLVSLSEKYNKPISVHSRRSLDLVFEKLSSFNTKRVLLHWFDGNKKQLQKAMDMGFYVSFGPVMIYANDKQVLLSKADESRILVETDGPVKFSRCFEMKSGQITFIPSIIFAASKILGKTFDDAAKLFENNSRTYLGI